MRNNAKISVIIPVYNVENHLTKCLNSVINQTYKNLEIILINDGSVDNSPSICEKFASIDDRIKYFSQENAGVSKARNKGIALATGDYFHFLDSDDYLEVDSYEYMLEEMETSGSDAICFEYYTTYPNREIKHIANDNVYKICNNEEAIQELLFSNRSFLCTKLLPAYSIKDLKFLEEIYRDEDTIFCMFALNKVQSTVYVDRPLLHYVQSEQSATRGKFRVNQLSAIDAIPIVENFLMTNYPKMVNRWHINYLHLMIMLYVDMWLDSNDYHAEMFNVYNVFNKLYKDTDLSEVKSIKEKMKMKFFHLSPNMFCRIHKIIFKL